MGIVWFTFPYMDRYAHFTMIEIDAKIERIEEARQRLSAQREQLVDQIHQLSGQDS